MIFQTAISFTEEIERIKKKNKIDYIDSVIKLCEDKGIEYETAAYWIKKDKSLQLKIQVEAEDLNILKKGSRLPID